MLGKNHAFVLPACTAPENVLKPRQTRRAEQSKPFLTCTPSQLPHRFWPPLSATPTPGLFVALAAPAPVLGRGAGKGCQQGWKMAPQPPPLTSNSAEDSDCQDRQQKGESLLPGIGREVLGCETPPPGAYPSVGSPAKLV